MIQTCNETLNLLAGLRKGLKIMQASPNIELNGLEALRMLKESYDPCNPSSERATL